jgi:hypothetical protein
LCASAALPIVAAASPPEPNPMLHASGTRLVDGLGAPIRLRGVFLDNWLLWSGNGFGAGFASETTIKRRLAEALGDAGALRFEDAIEDSFVGEADIAAIAKMGFNTVRVPFSYRVLEDDEHPFAYKKSGWATFDRLMGWCETHHVYVVLDMHSAPGGQSRAFVNDPGPVLLWDSDEEQNRTVALWRAIAARYRDRSVVAGYDLLNEPNVRDGSKLIQLYTRIAGAIRAVDRNHLIFFEGNVAATDFSAFTNPITSNEAYSFHSYALFGIDRTPDQLQHLQALAKTQAVPIWNGEFGANTLAWVTSTVQLFDAPSNGVTGWIFWPWKRVSSGNETQYRDLLTIEPGALWRRLARYVAGLPFKPSPADAEQGAQDFLRAMAVERCTVDAQIQAALK